MLSMRCLGSSNQSQMQSFWAYSPPNDLPRERKTAMTSKVVILSSDTPSESEPSGDEYRPDEQSQGGQGDDM